MRGSRRLLLPWATRLALQKTVFSPLAAWYPLLLVLCYGLVLVVCQLLAYHNGHLAASSAKVRRLTFPMAPASFTYGSAPEYWIHLVAVVTLLAHGTWRFNQTRRAVKDYQMRSRDFYKGLPAAVFRDAPHTSMPNMEPMMRSHESVSVDSAAPGSSSSSSIESSSSSSSDSSVEKTVSFDSLFKGNYDETRAVPRGGVRRRPGLTLLVFLTCVAILGFLTQAIVPMPHSALEQMAQPCLKETSLKLYQKKRAKRSVGAARKKTDGLVASPLGSNLPVVVEQHSPAAQTPLSVAIRDGDLVPPLLTTLPATTTPVPGSTRREAAQPNAHLPLTLAATQPTTTHPPTTAASAPAPVTTFESTMEAETTYAVGPAPGTPTAITAPAAAASATTVIVPTKAPITSSTASYDTSEEITSTSTESEETSASETTTMVGEPLGTKVINEAAEVNGVFPMATANAESTRTYVVRFPDLEEMRDEMLHPVGAQSTLSAFEELLAEGPETIFDEAEESDSAVTMELDEEEAARAMEDGEIFWATRRRLQQYARSSSLAKLHSYLYRTYVVPKLQLDEARATVSDSSCDSAGVIETSTQATVHSLGMVTFLTIGTLVTWLCTIWLIWRRLYSGACRGKHHTLEPSLTSLGLKVLIVAAPVAASATRLFRSLNAVNYSGTIQRITIAAMLAYAASLGLELRQLAAGLRENYHYVLARHIGRHGYNLSL